MSIERLQDAPRAVIEAWRRYDEAERKLREKYLSGKPGPVEQDAYESQLAARASERDAAIATIRSNADKENANDERGDQVAAGTRRRSRATRRSPRHGRGA